jgi:hypothetical protein
MDLIHLVALYDAPGFLDINRARAALWLLEQIDGGYLTFSQNAMSAEVLGDWCRGIVKDAISASLAATEEKIAGAVRVGKGEVTV